MRAQTPRMHASSDATRRPPPGQTSIPPCAPRVGSLEPAPNPLCSPAPGPLPPAHDLPVPQLTAVACPPCPAPQLRERQPAGPHHQRCHGEGGAAHQQPVQHQGEGGCRSGWPAAGGRRRPPRPGRGRTGQGGSSHGRGSRQRAQPAPPRCRSPCPHALLLHPPVVLRQMSSFFSRSDVLEKYLRMGKGWVGGWVGGWCIEPPAHRLTAGAAWQGASEPLAARPPTASPRRPPAPSRRAGFPKNDGHSTTVQDNGLITESNGLALLEQVAGWAGGWLAAHPLSGARHGRHDAARHAAATPGTAAAC